MSLSRRGPHRALTLLPLALALSACEGEPPAGDDADDAWVDATAEPNPLAAARPLLPWPSDQYLAPDESSPTGWRITVDPALMPEGVAPATIAHDGFSRVSPIVTYVPGPLDAACLPDATDWGATLDLSTTSVALLVGDDLTPWPALVELDATAEPADQASLLIRAHRPLPFDTDVTVVLTDRLCTTDGEAPAVSPGLTAALEGDTSDDAAAFWAAKAPRFEDAATAMGLEASDLVQAFTFHTRSEQGVIGRAVATQDVAGSAPLGSHTLEEITYEDDRASVYGTLEVPRFLSDDNRITLDAEGEVVQHGTFTAPFLITIPATVTTTRPAILFGHGFFSAIEEPQWSNLFQGLEQWEMAAVTTEFRGFAERYLGEVLPILGGRLDDLDTVIDQQLQSHADFTLVHRLIAEELATELEVDFGDGPFQPLDPDRLPYMGISNGGTQGLVMMTTSPVLDRGGLVVPGGGWSHMLQRASQWNTLGAALAVRYADGRDLQVVMSMFQQVFDPVDSLNYVQHLVDDRLPGRPAEPEILMVEAKEDAQVANMVTRWVAGEAGVPLLTPSPVPVWGLEEVTGPPPEGTGGRAALSIYDLGAEPLPTGNVAPEENDVHDQVRRLDSYKVQMGAFLEDGTILHPCDGPCDPD